MAAASRDRRKNGKIFSRILVHAGARFISGLVEGWKKKSNIIREYHLFSKNKSLIFFGFNNIEISLKIR